MMQNMVTINGIRQNNPLFPHTTNRTRCFRGLSSTSDSRSLLGGNDWERLRCDDLSIKTVESYATAWALCADYTAPVIS